MPHVVSLEIILKVLKKKQGIKLTKTKTGSIQ